MRPYLVFTYKSLPLVSISTKINIKNFQELFKGEVDYPASGAT